MNIFSQHFLFLSKARLLEMDLQVVSTPLQEAGCPLRSGVYVDSTLCVWGPQRLHPFPKYPGSGTLSSHFPFILNKAVGTANPSVPQGMLGSHPLGHPTPPSKRRFLWLHPWVVVMCSDGLNGPRRLCPQRLQCTDCHLP